MQDLTTALSSDGFDPYLTSVGGSGLGILSPYGQRQAAIAGPATPPETPNGDVDTGAPDPLRSTFETKTADELGSWADAQGKWLFV